MGQWHREHPELAGGPQDPWMQHAGYRAASQEVRRLDPGYVTCRNCGCETPDWEPECQLCGEERK